MQILKSVDSEGIQDHSKITHKNRKVEFDDSLSLRQNLEQKTKMN